MEYVIGIPSYRRAERQFTLGYLRGIGVDKSKIVVCVQSCDDYKAYKARGVDSECKLICHEASSAAENRNNILDYFSAGEAVILMDDDVISVERLNGDVLKPIESATEFDGFVSRGFNEAAKAGTIGFGVYPVRNAFFMSNRVRSRQICDAGLIGLVNVGIRFSEAFQSKEDYELCCRVIRECGAFVRLDDVTLNCKGGHVGGCENLYKDKRLWEKTAQRLATLYPDIVELRKDKAGEVRMRRTERAR